MAIARKKPSPASSKPSKSPTSIAEDPGALATLEEMAKSKAASKISKEKTPNAIKTPKKKASKKAEKDKAQQEKAKVAGQKPGKFEKTIMGAVLNATKTPKKKSSDSQKGPKNTSPELVKNPDPSQNGNQEPKPGEKRTAEAFLTCQAYAESLVKKSRYKDTELGKLVFAAFLALPECEDHTQLELADFIGVHRNTITNWRFDSKVIKARNEIIERHFQGNTPGVLQALVDGAKRTSWVNGLGDAAMIKLYLQYVEKWQEKQEVDLTSGGSPISWGLAPSQFIKPDAIPDSEETEEDADD